jgi:hypothetical protein
MSKDRGWSRYPTATEVYRTRQPLPPHALGAMAGAMEEEAWEAVAYRAPSRAATREADVMVPMMQAVITGVLGGAVVLMASLGAVVARGWPWWAVPVCSGGAALAIATAQWLRLLGETRALLVREERWERPQGLGDREQGTGIRETLRVEIKEEAASGGVRWTIDELPISREQLGVIARAVQGRAKRWSRRDLVTFHGIGEERAKQILADLEAHGYLTYPKGRNHPEGAQPTAKGRALFNAL